MNSVIEVCYRFLAYMAFGFCIEIFFTSISNVFIKWVNKKKITKKDWEFHGHVSLWMVPIYGLLLLIPFEILSPLIAGWAFYYRMVIWAITITGFEWLTGWLIYKYIGLRPWDYSTSWGAIPQGVGYTKWSYVPLWGIAGLFIEKYSAFQIKISPAVSEVVKGLF